MKQIVHGYFAKENYKFDKDITIHIVRRKHFFQDCFSNSEANMYTDSSRVDHKQMNTIYLQNRPSLSS